MKRTNNILLVSDTHFSPIKNDYEIKTFCEFLIKKNNFDTLFLLGDLFDYYYEYKYYIPKNYFIFFDILSYLSKRVEIHYWPGNHDYWHIDFLRNFDIEMHFSPKIMNIFGKKFYIAHGDNLRKNDFFNYFIKNEITQWFYRKLHPDFAYEIGKFVSKITSSKKNAIKLNKYIDFAEKKFNEGVDCLIIGHVHTQFLYKKDSKIFVIIGDWKQRRFYCEIKKGKIFLKCDIQSPR